jgi:tetratricopeptide (TPR) repeat protein
VSAIKVDSEALILDPTSISTYAARALAYSNVHDYKHAIEDMNTAVKLDCTETNHWALWSRAGIYEKSGDYQRAIDDYTSAIARSNRGGFVAPLYDRRAKLFQKVGRPKDAISDYTEILNHSADPSAFVSRGDLYQKILQPGLAIEDYTKALAFTESAKYQRREENPISSKTVYEKRAKAYTALGKSSLAEADRLQAQRETASEKPKATAAASKL